MRADPANVALADEHLRVVLAPTRGFLIAAVDDADSGAPLLWERRPPDPSPPSRDLGPPGPPSVDAFHERFAGGWFPMFPAAGFTAELDGRPTHFHGELASLPWELAGHGPDWAEARVETVATPFAAVRRVSLEGGELRVQTRVENTGDAGASYVYGEHPCFDRETFAGGRLGLAASAAWTPSPAFAPGLAMFRPGAEFEWPLVPGRHGTVDLALIPERPDRRCDQVCVELANGSIELSAPRFGRVAELELDHSAMPYAMLGMRFDETMDMLAIEPSGAPGIGVEDAVAAGAVRRLEPGEGFESTTLLRWKRAS